MKFLFIVFLIISTHTFGQADTGLAAIEEFQKELNKEYKDKVKSPLDPKVRKHFKGHEFFQADLKYRVTATLRITEPAPFFKMKTSSMATPEYRVFGVVEFVLDGTTFKLPVYQSKKLMATDTYRDYLFFPFTDLTNGTLTYPGGRYIELSIPKEGSEIVIDFNQAYNPYCAYSTRYSCPVVPAENHLDIEILAGVKYTPKK
ncbi:MAG TPA: DUF1684 domain-containing protein [Chryseolinea sp.]|nr:DUF1684 domain-containing protein [Chryseolinea sp.]HPM28933.1 DUF1684 domain-containing protein [Chryseolinea sp.]